MNYKQAEFTDRHHIPKAYFLYIEENANEYIIFQPNGQPPVGIQWNNTLSMPLKKRSFPEADAYIISVAEQVFIFSINDCTLKFKLPLHQPLEDVIVTDQVFLLLMETMLIVVSKTNYAINTFLEFPDVIEKLEVVEKRVKIQGISGEIFWVDI